MPRGNKKSRALKRRYMLLAEAQRPTPVSAEGSGNPCENVADVLVPHGEGKLKDVSGDVPVTGCYKGNVTSADQPYETRVCASPNCERFSRNGGERCTSHSITFLAFLHENENLTKADLDLVLDKGSVLYQQAPNRYAADGIGDSATGELSDLVPSRSWTLLADLTQRSLHGSFENPAPGAVETFLPLATGLHCLVTDVQYALLFMGSHCIAVFRTASGRFGFFDPHARSEDGSLVESGGTGAAVMVTFSRLCDLVERLMCCYELLGVSPTEVYELKAVTFHSTSTADPLAPNTQSVVAASLDESKSQSRTSAAKVCLPKEFAEKLSKCSIGVRRKLLRRFLAQEKRCQNGLSNKGPERSILQTKHTEKI